VQKQLPIKAIDNAFINHVGKLFDRLVNDLETEAGANQEELRNSRIPPARSRFERSFAFARQAHSQMIEHIESLGELT